MTKPDASIKVGELYGLPTFQSADWQKVVGEKHCPFLDRTCLKCRKSSPNITIGSCTIMHGSKSPRPVIVCPHRLLERWQIFQDCTHLLKLHEPGNELRIVAELNVPGGNIDYCLVSLREGKPRDFVGIELQTLDTTGTIWPKRQRFLQAQGVKVKAKDAASNKSFGINWKMTAKTTLVQLHHKIGTFEHLSKCLVLVLQDCQLDYLRQEFSFAHVLGQRDGDSMQFHAYELRHEATAYKLHLHDRVSTDGDGIARCLGLQTTTKVELQAILARIEAKLPQSIPLTIDAGTLPIPKIGE